MISVSSWYIFSVFKFSNKTASRKVWVVKFPEATTCAAFVPFCSIPFLRTIFAFPYIAVPCIKRLSYAFFFENSLFYLRFKVFFCFLKFFPCIDFFIIHCSTITAFYLNHFSSTSCVCRSYCMYILPRIVSRRQEPHKSAGRDSRPAGDARRRHIHCWRNGGAFESATHLENEKVARKCDLFILAERAGFEPACPLRQTDFESAPL